MTEIKKIIEAYKANPRGYPVSLAGKEALKKLYAVIPFEVHSPMEAIFVYESGLTIRPSCHCGDNVNFNKGLKEYGKFCSPKCAGPTQIANMKKTNLIKYGVEHSSQDPAIYEKIKAKTKEKYGVEHPLQSKEIQEKWKATNKEKYGVENPMQSSEIRESVKLSNFEKHGEYSINFNRSDVVAKRRATMVERYGVEFTSQNVELLAKMKESNHKSFWGEHAGLLSDPEQFSIYYGELGSRGLANKLGTSTDTILKYLRKYGIKTNAYRSLLEEELGIFLLSIEPNIKTNKKIVSGFETDFSHDNLAIEIHGLYWHCQNKQPDTNYHLKKMTKHIDAGHKIIQIFQNEWEQKREIVESRLKYLLGKATKGAPARKTIVREIPWQEAKTFLDTYHLQGAGTPGNYRIGAFYDEQLVAVMTFSKGRKALNSIGKGWELLRYASDFELHSGVASKLLTHFERIQNPDKLTTYADRRWSDGNIYKQLGFTFDSFTAPSYWYTSDHQTLKHRFHYNKQKTIEMGGDTMKTEWENMQDFGFDRIWDCGNSKWIKTY